MVWAFNNDYDLTYSWLIGAQVNDPWYGDRPEAFAPWHSAKAVVFWPPPFDPQIPRWAEHFVSYVRGAHRITDLPE